MKSHTLKQAGEALTARTRTSQFLQHRSTAQRRRQHAKAWDSGHTEHDEHAAMIQTAENSTNDTFHLMLPPEWIDTVEEIQDSIREIKDKMVHLAKMHDKHLNRPALDETDDDQERAIEIMTQSITSLFHGVQRSIQGLGARARRGGTQQERTMCTNVMTALATQLQAMSSAFRKAQSEYLQRIRGRKERKRQFFDPAFDGLSHPLEPEIDLPLEKEFTEAQLALLQDNTRVINARDREIAKIAASINELSEIFKELSVLIIDQGTILDRIDYNLEHVATTVAVGRDELSKGEVYQKRSRKLFVILILVILIVVMLVLLAFK